jgi:hypothetical protein
MHGLFAKLVPTASAAKDFSLQLSAASATVTRGGSTNLNISSTASGGFNSPINLSCTGAPTGVTCAFNPATITPGGTTASSHLTIAVGTSYVPPTHYTVPASLAGLGLIGLVWGARRKKSESGKARKAWMMASLVLLAALAMAAVGCGSSSNGRTAPPATTMMVVGTSGGVSHSSPVTLTIQ